MRSCCAIVAVLYGPTAVFFIAAFGPFVGWQVLATYLLWLFVTRTIKLCIHLRHKPSHILYVIHYIFFNYVAAIVKLYALVTLDVTDWGTRPGDEKQHEEIALAVAADDEDSEDEDWDDIDLYTQSSSVENNRYSAT